MGKRRGMHPDDGLFRARQFAGAPLASSPEEFIQRHNLGEAVSVARELASKHFGDRFTTLTCNLQVEDWRQYVEVEIGTSVSLDDFLEMRDRYLDAFEAACPDVDSDRLHLSVC